MASSTRPRSVRVAASRLTTPARRETQARAPYGLEGSCRRPWLRKKPIYSSSHVESLGPSRRLMRSIVAVTSDVRPPSFVD